MLRATCWYNDLNWVLQASNLQICIFLSKVGDEIATLGFSLYLHSLDTRLSLCVKLRCQENEHTDARGYSSIPCSNKMLELF